MIKQAEFITSSVTIHQCPASDKPEYAFIGRSNVGKSSLINYLTNNKKLAKISSTPGKTQTINHFLINKSWYIVDLPGYGFARISKKQRIKWEQNIRKYLLMRSSLYCLFTLIDARIPPQKNDLEFIEWLGVSEIPFAIVFTKVDNKNKRQCKVNIKSFQSAMLEKWENLPSTFTTSSVSRIGKEDLLTFIQQVNNKENNDQ